MNISNFYQCESGSRRSTEEDNSSEGESEYLYQKTNPSKHKTQLCKTFSELGCCPYDRKCRFAHGPQELVRVSAGQGLKGRKCNGFWKNGVCSYGIRCQFGHASSQWQTSAALKGLEAICVVGALRTSRLLRRLA